MKPNPLEEALRLTNGDRQKDYGHPLDDFKRVAAMWSVILGVEVKPEQIPLCMIALKLSRQCHKHKDGNLVGIAGHVNTLFMVKEKQATEYNPEEVKVKLTGKLNLSTDIIETKEEKVPRCCDCFYHHESGGSPRCFPCLETLDRPNFKPRMPTK